MVNAISVNNDNHIEFDANAFSRLDFDGKAKALEVARNHCFNILSDAKTALKSKYLFERGAAASDICTMYGNDFGVLESIIGACKDSANSNALNETRNDVKRYFDKTIMFLNNAKRSYLDDVKAYAVFFGGKIKEIAIGAVELLKEAATKIWTAIKSCATKIRTAIKSCATKIWTAIKSCATKIWTAIKSCATKIWTAIKSCATELGRLTNNVVDWCKEHPAVATLLVACILLGVGYGIYSIGYKSAMAAVTQIASAASQAGNSTPVVETYPIMEDIEKSSRVITQKVESYACDYKNAFAQAQCRRG